MANADRPRGLFPVRHLNGNPWNGKVNMYLVVDSLAMYRGDIVKLAGSAGAAGDVVYGQDVEGMPTIARCTVGDGTDTPVGVVVGFLSSQPVVDVEYKRADATKRIALVVDDPSVVFQAQEDAATTPLTNASIGLNIQFSVTAGSTATGQSGIELVSTLVGSTTTTPLRLLGLSKIVGNAFNTGGSNTDNATFDVVFNQHAYKGVAGF